MDRRRTMSGFAALGLVAAVLGGCGGDAKDELSDAVGSVEAKQRAVDDATAAFAAASTAFCDAAKDDVVALDRYGDLLADTAVTVGDVTTAGSDLGAPRKDVEDAVDDVTEAHADLVEAQQELDAAKADESGSTTSEPAVTTTTAPLLAPATVARVEQAESDLDTARAGITDATPLVEAGQQFNAAAFSLEVAWLRVMVEAGCLSDEQLATALTAVQQYTTALQASLQAAGHFDGEIDGVYGPETVAAVSDLQEEAGLPVTGYVDKATATALAAGVAATGGAIASQSTATTASVQTLLTLTGFWQGPIDGQWTPELTDAVIALQTALQVPPTGAMDAITLQAVQNRLAELRSSDGSATTTAPTTSIDGPSTTVDAGA